MASVDRPACLRLSIRRQVQCLRQRFTLDSRAIQIDSIFDQRLLFEERADIGEHAQQSRTVALAGRNNPRAASWSSASSDPR